jgi:hypothetical protein
MTSERKAIHLSMVLSIAACFIGAHDAQAQQSAAPTHFGASAFGSASTASAGVAARSNRSGAVSTWGAGRATLGNSAQPGGVWRDRTPPGATRATMQTHTVPAGDVSAGGALPPESFSAKPAGVRRDSALGAAHLSRSSPNRHFGTKASSGGYAVQPFGKRHVAVGSRDRVTSMGRVSGKGRSRPSASLASPMGKHSQRTGTVAGFSQRSGQNTRSNARGEGPLP